MRTHTKRTTQRFRIHALSSALALVLIGSAAAANEPAGRPGVIHARADALQVLQRAGDSGPFHHALALAQSLPAPAARAPTLRKILSLADSGSGSLREALATAANGDVIDLQGLAGRITLSSPLTTSADVTIKGSGRDLLTLDGGGKGRVITSAGSLSLTDISLTNGRATPSGGSTVGGCLYTAGNLNLQNATISGCSVGDAETEMAYGGAVAVGGTAYIKYSTISNSSATAFRVAAGAGIIAGQNLMFLQGTISGNHVNQVLAPDGTLPAAAPYFLAIGGGVTMMQPDSMAYLIQSDVSGNTVSANGGYYTHVVDGSPVTDFAYGKAYGGGTASGFAGILGTTVANNTAQANGDAFGGGLFLAAVPPTPRAGRATPSSLTGAWLGREVTGPPTYSMAKYSEIAGNSATTTSTYAYGGGIHAKHPLTIAGSAIHDNHVISEVDSGYTVGGGGILSSYGELQVLASTISGNVAQAQTGSAMAWGGGIAMYYAVPLTLIDSTVSANQILTSYGSSGGGIAASTVQLSNSTIAFNSAPSNAGGVMLYGSAAGARVIQSTIISNNSSIADPSAADLVVYDSGASVDGDHNITITSNGVTWTVPPLTDDPLLQALAFNGGPTKTHALGVGSPAIDAGSNPLPVDFDQRGYARTVGANPDVGAFEVDNDRIFTDGFDARLGGL